MIFRVLNSLQKIFPMFYLLAPLNLYGEYSPNIGVSYSQQPFWGDTHLHTSLSVDIGVGTLRSGKSLLPSDAYRFARGEIVTSLSGIPMRRHRALDFIIVADHAENIGLATAILNNDPELLKSKDGRKLQEAYSLAVSLGLSTDQVLEGFGIDGRSLEDKAFTQSVWSRVTAAADQFNRPGEFTAFIGYEWTSVDTNLHRVVVIKDDAKTAQQFLPYSQFDSNRPEDLWQYLARYERETGGSVFAIPHNGNLSGGYMFLPKNSSGLPINAEYSKKRSYWEPLYEVTQIKGDSETHPFLSPSDEFADYETWRSFFEIEEDNKLRPHEYARSALKLGLDQQARLGVNPFDFGLVGGTDAHGALSAVAENNFIGKGDWLEPKPERVTKKAYGGQYKDYNFRIIPGWKLNAAGYTAVWAEENTRESIFTAMRRKEVYASTGPRITVRFFGGWDYEGDDAYKVDLARIGYRKGVPMGGDLTAAPQNKSPKFLIRAVRDPDGANLDRVQVIKGWLDEKSQLQEKIYNVALSGNRKENLSGKVDKVGDTVDITNASYTNTIGDPELAVVWEDPDFNSNQLAFYYIRVLEIPTPRWTAYDAKYFGLKDLPEEIPMVTQERAYSSPIWYTPSEYTVESEL